MRIKRITGILAAAAVVVIMLTACHGKEVYLEPLDCRYTPGIHDRRNRDPSHLDRRRLQTLPLHSFRIPPGTIRDTVQYHLRGRRSPRMLEDRQRERLPNFSRGERSINQILISGALRARRPSPSAEHRRPFPSFVDHRFFASFLYNAPIVYILLHRRSARSENVGVRNTGGKICGSLLRTKPE